MLCENLTIYYYDLVVLIVYSPSVKTIEIKILGWIVKVCIVCLHNYFYFVLFKTTKIINHMET